MAFEEAAYHMSFDMVREIRKKDLFWLSPAQG